MKQLSYAFLILLFTISLSGCGGDNSTGPETEGDPPTIPDLTEVAQPDISFFEENNPQGTKGRQILNDDYSAYSSARFKAIFGTFFASLGQIYMGYLNPAYNEAANFEDGTWEWSYNYSAEGQSVSTRFTAEQQAGSTNWAMFISFDDGQGGGFDNYKVMEGNTTDDGTEGEWTFYVLDQSGEAAASTEWNATSDTERTLTTEIFDDGALDVTFTYEQNGADHTMTFTEAGNSDTDTVFWNTDSQTGYVMEDGSKLCWDANLMNTTCS
ncbi:hypothetical protein [Fodinibius salsisoli]|uniref:Uncharacterized protein n=1 Tax=Fodinibius salsisoli TaxID=2820877 RepID=A0ABT3PJA7_9BACT|nr:hypothetical protein [Fodinibius salsisoli]MCW9705989.1 hypothetical protein [Fodinibius salsisoli]